MAEEKLYVLLNNLTMGELFRSTQGKLRFCYDEVYLRDGPNIPLSLSMPLLKREHPHERISPFLWGLLPDNDLLLERWAARFHISASNPFALLSVMGEDCAGAIRFVCKEGVHKKLRGGKKLLSSAQIEKRLLALARDPSLGRTAEDQGQFSLAGAQAKTALQKVESRWFLPYASQPREQRFSMRIDRSYRDDQIHLHHFEKMARQCEYPYAQLEQMVNFFCETIPAISVGLYDDLRKKGLRHPILGVLQKKLYHRCKMIEKIFLTKKVPV